MKVKPVSHVTPSILISGLDVIVVPATVILSGCCVGTLDSVAMSRPVFTGFTTLPVPSTAEKISSTSDWRSIMQTGDNWGGKNIYPFDRQHTQLIFKVVIKTNVEYFFFI